jgi:hypothetical protein
MSYYKAYSGACDIILVALAWKVVLSLFSMKLAEKIGVGLGMSLGVM